MSTSLSKMISNGKTNIAFGMTWFTIQETENLMRTTDQVIKDSVEPIDLYLLRKTELKQFALARSTDGLTSKSFSGAAILAEQYGPESWIYVLEIHDLIWICAGRNGYILPDGDKLYNDPAQAEEAFANLSPASYKYLALPHSWQAQGRKYHQDGLEETDLDAFLDHTPPKWSKLQNTASNANILKITAALLILGAASFAFYSVLSEPETIVKPNPDLVNKLMSEGSVNKREEYARLDSIRPWTTEAPAGKQLELCIDEITTMPIYPVGYEVQSVDCYPGKVSANVSRSNGYSSWLHEWVKEYPRLKVKTVPTGANGSISKSIEVIPVRQNIDLDSKENFPAIQKAIFETGQVDGSGITISQPAIKQYPDFPEYEPLWASGNYSIKTKRPELWLEFFNQWSPMVITNVAYRLQKETYVIEGKYYVPNF